MSRLLKRSQQTEKIIEYIVYFLLLTKSRTDRSIARYSGACPPGMTRSLYSLNLISMNVAFDVKLCPSGINLQKVKTIKLDKDDELSIYSRNIKSERRWRCCYSFFGHQQPILRYHSFCATPSLQAILPLAVLQPSFPLPWTYMNGKCSPNETGHSTP